MMTTGLVLLVACQLATGLAQDIFPRASWCGGGACFEGDEELFRELEAVHAAEPHGEQKWELEDNMRPLFEMPARNVRDEQPHVIYKYRMAHGETANWLNYAQQRVPRGLVLSELVQKRGAYRAGVYENHQHFPDCLNRELFNYRPENRRPFAPRGVWSYLDDFMEILEKNADKFTEEVHRINGQDLSSGGKLTEHEHGIQDPKGTGKWFMTRPLMGYECTDPGTYTWACPFFRKIEQRWKQKFNVSHRIYEAKYLIMHPDVWIRPHTADSNQQMKIHLALANPGQHATMYSCNDTINWQPGKAHLFDDSFLHEVKTTAPVGTPPRIILDIKMDHPDSRAVPLYGDGTMLVIRDAFGNSHLSNAIWSQIVVQLDGDMGRDANTAFAVLAARGTKDKPYDPCPFLPGVGEPGYAELSATVTIYTRMVVFAEPMPEPIARCFQSCEAQMQATMHELKRGGDAFKEEDGREKEEERREDQDEEERREDENEDELDGSDRDDL